MEFWAIGYKYKKGFFFDFEENKLTETLTENCFLPSLKMAEEFLEKEFEYEFIAVKVKVEYGEEEKFVFSYQNQEFWETEKDEEVEEDKEVIYEIRIYDNDNDLSESYDVSNEKEKNEVLDENYFKNKEAKYCTVEKIEKKQYFFRKENFGWE